MKKIFTVSLVAIMAATAANADIASTKYVTDRTGNTAFTGSVEGSADLTAAVNALAGKVDTVAGNGQGSVADQITSALEDYTNTTDMNSAISSAKTELQGNIDTVDGKADANAGEISTLKSTSATKTELSSGLALKEDVANKSNSLSETSTDVQYPTAKAVYKFVEGKMQAISNDQGALETTVNGLSSGLESLQGKVAENKTAADTGIDEAKAAAAKALTDAKSYADTQDTAQTTAITNAYQAADKKITESIGTVEQGKTVVQMITEAKEAASGDAGEVASDLADYISSNNTAVSAAQEAANKAQGDLDAYKTSNNTAVAAAKKAGDDAQADLNAYKTSNNTAVAAAKKAGDDAQADLNAYKTSNNAAVAAAKKAGDDAQADLNAYKTSNDAAVAKAKTDAIAAAKDAGDLAYAAKSYEGRVEANETAISKIDIAAAQTLSENQGDGQYALTMTKSGDTLTYKWEQIGR